jgi:hypothetical protein
VQSITDRISDSSIHNGIVELITVLVVAYALLLLLRGLRRSRPDLNIAAPIAAAIAVRVLAAAAVSSTSIAGTLRGGDELTFLFRADLTSHSSFLSSDWITDLTQYLHQFVFALQMWALDSPEFGLRIGQVGIAVAGITLLAAAVYELAGPRAALIAAWLLALEPSGVFFSSLLHKEANMMLASGLVAFGGATMWNRANLFSLFPVVIGCLIAVATRPYAGWFLIAAGAAITLHAGLRGTRDAAVRPLMLVAIVAMFGAIAAPTVWEASTDEELEELQRSQDTNAANQEVNLSLERVDFSTREAILTNVWTRIPDVLFRPYPWQLDNSSQRFGLLGTAVFIPLLVLLVAAVARNKGSIMARAGPLVYIGFFLLIAYSLSAGNAGTAFRYKVHLVALVICVLAALRFAEAPRPEPAAEARWPRRTPRPALERGVT